VNQRVCGLNPSSLYAFVHESRMWAGYGSSILIQVGEKNAGWWKSGQTEYWSVSRT
jgi:hypothetical protein